jgi:PHD/YefM family antitoxin component YafN of YafNO toxin-antitoxin module
MIAIKYDDFGANAELFARLCEMTSEPLRLVKEGCPDLIVMDAEAFDKRQRSIELREQLLNTDSELNLDTQKLKELVSGKNRKR